MSRSSLQGRTVFVTGAGASMELGFPSGPELLGRVVELLDKAVKGQGDTRFLEAVYQTLEDSVMLRPYTEPEVAAACNDIISYLPLDSSIDNFLFSRSEDYLIQRIGKMAIADVILRAERSSRLFMGKPNPSRLSEGIRNSWLTPFSKLIIEKCPRTPDAICERLGQIAVITFNYDRSVEYFLVLLLAGYFRLSKDDIEEALSHIEVHHVYGSLGSFISDDNDYDYTPYGQATEIADLHEMSRKIITFNEGIDDDNSRIPEMKELLRKAKRTIFLGFAYHKQSIDLLITKTPHNRKTQSVYGTCKGVAQSQNKEIISRAGSFLSPFGTVPQLEDATCADFLTDYLLTLSFA